MACLALSSPNLYESWVQYLAFEDEVGAFVLELGLLLLQAASYSHGPRKLALAFCLAIHSASELKTKFSLVGFKGNLSLLDSFFLFFQGGKSKWR